MTKRVRYSLLFSILIVLLTVQSIPAQESGIIQATATVLSALTIRGTNNLQFMTVTPGINKTVDKADVGFAGEWEITGEALVEITLDFTLPDSLILQDSTVGMPVSFSNTDASYEDGTGGGQTSPAGLLNPHALETRNIGATGYMWVWIGGTVLPRLTQTGGDYSADIVLTIALTGS